MSFAASALHPPIIYLPLDKMVFGSSDESFFHGNTRQYMKEYCSTPSTSSRLGASSLLYGVLGMALTQQSLVA